VRESTSSFSPIASFRTTGTLPARCPRQRCDKRNLTQHMVRNNAFNSGNGNPVAAATRCDSGHFRDLQYQSSHMENFSQNRQNPLDFRRPQMLSLFMVKLCSTVMIFASYLCMSKACHESPILNLHYFGKFTNAASHMGCHCLVANP